MPPGLRGLTDQAPRAHRCLATERLIPCNPSVPGDAQLPQGPPCRLIIRFKLGRFLKVGDGQVVPPQLPVQLTAIMARKA